MRKRRPTPSSIRSRSDGASTPRRPTPRDLERRCQGPCKGLGSEEPSRASPIDRRSYIFGKDDQMKYLGPGLALVLLGTPAMAQSVGEKTGVNSTLGIAPKSEDFVKQVAISDMFEIQSSQIAQ